MSQQNAHHRGIRRAKYLLSTATIALFATGAGITATAAQDNQANDDDDFEDAFDDEQYDDSQDSELDEMDPDDAGQNEAVVAYAL